MELTQDMQTIWTCSGHIQQLLKMFKDAAQKIATDWQYLDGLEKAASLWKQKNQYFSGLTVCQRRVEAFIAAAQVDADYQAPPWCG